MKPFLGPAQRKVLWAILCAAQDGRCLTFREIQALMGAKSPRAAVSAVEALRKKGLVSDCPGYRTLRPLVRVEFFPEAGNIQESRIH